MEDWNVNQSRKKRVVPTFSSALLEAISRSTESSQGQTPQMETTHYNNTPSVSKPMRRSADDFTVHRQNCNCNSSSCKWKNVARDYNGLSMRKPPIYSMPFNMNAPAISEKPLQQMPKVEDSKPKVKVRSSMREPPIYSTPFNMNAPDISEKPLPQMPKVDDSKPKVKARTSTKEPPIYSTPTPFNIMNAPAISVKPLPQMPKVEDSKPKVKARSPGSKLASFLSSLFIPTNNLNKKRSQGVDPRVPKSDDSSSTYSRKSRSQNDSASNSSYSKERAASHSLSACSSSSSNSGSFKQYKHKHSAPAPAPAPAPVPTPARKRYENPPFYHTKHNFSSPCSTSNKEKNLDNGRQYLANMLSQSMAKHLAYLDSSPCSTSNKEKNLDKNRRCVRFGPNLLGKYSSPMVNNSRNLVEENEYDSDGDSDSSSDLFELNIYSRDLPVYETTHLQINKAIAKGLL